MKQILTVAGSDSGGGAGIQADIKSIHANGGFAMSVITSVTAQNTCEVTSAFDLPIEIIEAQIDAVFSDFEVSAVKTGMLSSAEIVRVVARKLHHHSPAKIVVDPVMISKSGFQLLQESAIETIKSDLIPLATVITPNVHEAQLLSGLEIQNVKEAEVAAENIHQLSKKGKLEQKIHMALAAPTQQRLQRNLGWVKILSLALKLPKITLRMQFVTPLRLAMVMAQQIISTFYREVVMIRLTAFRLLILVGDSLIFDLG